MLHTILKPPLKALNLDHLFLLGKFAPLFFPTRYEHLFSELKSFCLFIGHGRSGSTLVGHLLNAHPNIVMSNELDALKYLDKGLTQKQLFALIHFVSKRVALRGSLGGGNYKYAVPGQYQGRHKKLQVIGDRKAGATSIRILKKPELLQNLKQSITVNKKFIHVVRNPFDTISTTFKKTHRKPDENSESHLKRAIGYYFDRCNTVQTVKKEFADSDLMLVFHEDLIAEPKINVKKLCDFLGVESTQGYLDDCAKIVMTRPHKARRTIEWTTDLINLVESRMDKFPWLKKYSYCC